MRSAANFRRGRSTRRGLGARARRSQNAPAVSTFKSAPACAQAQRQSQMASAAAFGSPILRGCKSRPPQPIAAFSQKTDLAVSDVVRASSPCKHGQDGRATRRFLLAKHVPANVEMFHVERNRCGIAAGKSAGKVDTFHVKRWEPQRGRQLMRPRRRQGGQKREI